MLKLLDGGILDNDSSVLRRPSLLVSGRRRIDELGEELGRLPSEEI
jgi:hypothetical protein